jgi:DNA (cytosine-5)-methyltransferase 1
VRYLSVCSGIEAATVAWHPLGWTPVAFSEIDPFASAVLKHYYPAVPKWGDMTRYKEWPSACECVAHRPTVCEPWREDDQQKTTWRTVGRSGRNWRRGTGRSGIHGERASTSSGRDSRICGACGGSIIDVLVGGTPCQSFSVAGLRQGLADPRGNLALTYLAILDRYHPAWCCWENVPGVLSADDGGALGAFLGGLGHLGYGFAYRVLDAQYFGLAQRRKRVFVVGYLGDWRRAAAVLFERESLSGHPAPRREAGQGVTAGIAGSLGAGDGNRGWRNDLDRGSFLPVAFGGNNTAGAIDVATAVNAHGGPHGRLDFESETFIATAFDARQSDVIQYGDKSGPLDTDGHTIAVGFYANGGAQGGSAFDGIAPTPKTGGLSCVAHKRLRSGMQVRRLTPRECERLQGFPDDYTLIPYRGKPAADGPRYKALGNSMAVPVMAWIGRRIQLLEDALAELGEGAA